MKKLLKQYNFTSVDQYFDMCFESYLNGQISQCKNQVKVLTKQDKKDLYNYGFNLGEMIDFKKLVFELI